MEVCLNKIIAVLDLSHRCSNVCFGVFSPQFRLNAGVQLDDFGWLQGGLMFAKL